MCISTVIKIATDHGTLMINGERSLLHAKPGAAVGWAATSPGLTSAHLPPQLNQR